MEQVLRRMLGLLRRPAVVGVLLVLAGGGSALVALPLFGQPGYELSGALALAAGLLGGIVGISAGRQERRIISSIDPRPKGAMRRDGAFASAGLAVGAAAALLLLSLLPPFLVSVVHSLVASKCNPFANVAFFALLPPPSALLAAAMGAFCGLLARTRRMAVLTYALGVLLSGLLTVWPILFGPQVQAYNHFGSYVPGPLYDETLELRPGLLAFRAQTLLLVMALWSFTALFLDMKRGSLTGPHFRPISFFWLGLSVFGAVVIQARAPQLAIHVSDSYLQDKLGGHRSTANFELYFPRGKPRLEVERMARDLEFRHGELKEFFGRAPEGKIRVYLYRTASEKAALVGAGQTQFAKPWMNQLHLNPSGFPHTSLKHELVHVMAAPFGSGPFAVTTRFGVIPIAAIIEGIAVAGDNPIHDLTLHESVAGMRKLNLAPNLRKLLGPEGFYTAAAGRAYTTAGSFLLWLAETRGAEKLRALYKTADFQGVYSQPVDELISEWEKMLDALPLDEATVNQAFARFRHQSLFARSCAREVAELADQAAQHLPSDPERSLELYERAAKLQSKEPTFRIGQARALQSLARFSEAEARLTQIAPELKDSPALLAEVEMVRADIAWEQGELEIAKDALSRVIELKTSATTDRSAHVKLHVLERPDPSGALKAYFTPGEENAKFLRLLKLQAQWPEDGILQYLVGRRMSQMGAFELALEPLGKALAQTLPLPVQKEAIRMQLEAAFLSGDCAQVRDIAGKLPDLGAAVRAQSKHWVRRCEFEENNYSKLLRP